MMKSTLGAPSLARSGSGQDGLDWSTVRPMTPLKAVLGLYSLSDIGSPIKVFFNFFHDDKDRKTRQNHIIFILKLILYGFNKSDHQ
jgi:hypothetical protein